MYNCILYKSCFFYLNVCFTYMEDLMKNKFNMCHMGKFEYMIHKWTLNFHPLAPYFRKKFLLMSTIIMCTCAISLVSWFIHTCRGNDAK